MTTLPASYATGTVVFNAVLSLGDITGDGAVDPAEVNGEITFTPAEPIYIAQTVPRTVVGNQSISYRVVSGVLVDALGAPGVQIPVGRWRISFDLEKMTVPGAVIDVMDSHVPSAPLDLPGKIVLPSTDSPDGEEEGPGSTLIITDTGDGGYVIAGQNFLDENGALRTVSVVENEDGSVDLDISETT